ncbi:MAG: hypothetical protein FWC51_02955 [Proteobacteria bacterium]|nr:hypothetical protein [Pseudomonadota bacterium]
MPIDKILQLLQNSGFRNARADGQFIWMEDPTCITRSVSDFIHYAWIAITIATAFMLLGWAVAILRSGKVGGIANNMRNLFLIFAILSAAVPIGNAIYGGDMFGAGCKQISVRIDDVQKILAARDSKLKTADANSMGEEFDIRDTGATATAVAETPPESAAPEFVDINGQTVETDNNAASPVERMPASAAPSNAAATRLAASSRAVSATVSGNAVIYTDSRGVRRMRSGGSSAWRNNNPGNITCGAGLIFGAVACNGRFLVFPDEDAGMRAIVSNLKSRSYQNARASGCPDMPTGSLGAAICRWAPPNENNTAAYQRTMEQKTGIPLHTQMSQLDDSQLARVAQTIRTVEGWVPKNETVLN